MRNNRSQHLLTKLIMPTLHPIGYITSSCFQEKFAIPRQPLLAPAARGRLVLLPPYDKAEAVQGLEEVSHIWLLFLFHQVQEKTIPRLKVRPPRLGGNRSLGIFATRSTHRPNGIGQSVVRLDQVQAGELLVSGIDLLDGTPILDIKPYVPYADCLPEARNNWAGQPPATIEVQWTTQARQQVRQHAERLQEPLEELIRQCLAQDPKPAYQQPDPHRIYGVRLWDTDVRWHYPEPSVICVLEITTTTP